jgi:hypothetical protein
VAKRQLRLLHRRKLNDARRTVTPGRNLRGENSATPHARASHQARPQPGAVPPWLSVAAGLRANPARRARVPHPPCLKHRACRRGGNFENCEIALVFRQFLKCRKKPDDDTVVVSFPAWQKTSFVMFHAKTAKAAKERKFFFASFARHFCFRDSRNSPLRTGHHLLLLAIFRVSRIFHLA